MGWHWKIFPLGIHSRNVLSRSQWHHKFQALPCCCQEHTKAFCYPMNPQCCIEENSLCICKRIDVCDCQHHPQTPSKECRSSNCTPGSNVECLAQLKHIESTQYSLIKTDHIDVTNVSSAERIGWFLNQSESRWASQNICKAWRQVMSGKNDLNLN